MKADDAVARFEARNKANLFAEEAERAEARRRARVIAFPRMDLIQRVLTEAAYRTAVALGLPPDACRAAIVPDPETKRYRPALDIEAGIVVDQDRVRAVFSFAFVKVREQWAFDLAYVDNDAIYAPQLAASLPRKEDVATFAQRVKDWVAA
jgi:hypothetical protein